MSHTAATGRLSNTARQTIFSMAEGGASLEEIAAAVGRTEEAVSRVLSPKPKGKSKKGKAKAAKRAAATRSARVKPELVAPSRKRAGQRDDGNLLKHRYWLRANLAISLSLPGDLRAKEAERLAEVVRNLSFLG